MQKYTDLAKINVLNPGKSAISSDVYFNKGTDVIALLIKSFDVNNNVILNDSKGWL
jgi:hypothetical protein